MQSYSAISAHLYLRYGILFWFWHFFKTKMQLWEILNLLLWMMMMKWKRRSDHSPMRRSRPLIGVQNLQPHLLKVKYYNSLDLNLSVDWSSYCSRTVLSNTFIGRGVWIRTSPDRHVNLSSQNDLFQKRDIYIIVVLPGISILWIVQFLDEHFVNN